MAKIGIIGAGMAALFVQRLSSKHAITLFEKSRGFGGRICTRRRDLGQFDHGRSTSQLAAKPSGRLLTVGALAASWPMDNGLAL